MSALDETDLATLNGMVANLNELTADRGIRLSNASLCWHDDEHADQRPLIGTLIWDDQAGYRLDVTP
jgi:hypothetical protein